MKFGTPNCPECGKPVTGTLESVQGTAEVVQNEDGSFDWGGNTEICWDSQETVHDDEGLVTASCEDHHEWQTSLGAD
jgi:hypothetical protein